MYYNNYQQIRNYNRDNQCCFPIELNLSINQNNRNEFTERENEFAYQRPNTNFNYNHNYNNNHKCCIPFDVCVEIKESQQEHCHEENRNNWSRNDYQCWDRNDCERHHECQRCNHNNRRNYLCNLGLLSCFCRNFRR